MIELKNVCLRILFILLSGGALSQPSSDGNTYQVVTRSGKIFSLKKEVVRVTRQGSRYSHVLMENAEGKFQEVEVKESVKKLNQWLNLTRINHGDAIQVEKVIAIARIPDKNTIIIRPVSFLSDEIKDMVMRHLETNLIETGPRNARILFLSKSGEIGEASVAKRSLSGFLEIFKQFDVARHETLISTFNRYLDNLPPATKQNLERSAIRELKKLECIPTEIEINQSIVRKVCGSNIMLNPSQMPFDNMIAKLELEEGIGSRAFIRRPLIPAQVKRFWKKLPKRIPL